MVALLEVFLYVHLCSVHNPPNKTKGKEIRNIGVCNVIYKKCHGYICVCVSVSACARVYVCTQGVVSILHHMLDSMVVEESKDHLLVSSQ